MNLTGTSKKALDQLYQAVDGQAGEYVWASNELHHNTAKALERRGLIVYEALRTAPDKWYRVAMTRAGIAMAGLPGTK